MKRRWLCPIFLLALAVALIQPRSAPAGPFNRGIGSAMYYGPYTGGHMYSYNVAYGYGFPFNYADTWRTDLYAARIYNNGTNPPYSLYYYHPPTRLAVPANPNAGPVPADEEPLRPVAASTPVGTATVRVQVPAGADVWFEGERTAQAGPERIFHSPPLHGGKSYIFMVRARWAQNGRPVEQFQPVSVQAGSQAVVHFPAHRP